MRDRRFFWLVGAAGAFGVVSVFWITTHPGHEAATVAFDDISETVAPLAAAVACLVAARHRRVVARLGWALIGLSALSWGLGQADWTYREVFLGQNPEALFPSWPDLGFLTSIPLGVAGLAAFPNFRGAERRISLILDGLLVVGGALFLSWGTVLGPIYANSPSGWVQQTLTLAYPLGDVCMGTMVILLLSRMTGGERQPVMFMGLGVLLSGVADSTFMYLTTVQNYGTENPANVGWTLGYLLIGLGALRAMTMTTAAGAAGHDHSAGRWRILLPYVPMLGAGLLALSNMLRGAGLDDFLLGDSFGIVGVVLLRQYLLVRDTRFLGLQLREQNRRLDHLVSERTRELYRSLEELGEANDRRTRLLARMVTLQDEERRRLSVIIHDDMLQWMTVGHMRLQRARRGVPDPKLAAALENADSAVQDSITRMRGLMSELHPQIVERGFTSALREYLEQVERGGELRCLLVGGFAADPTGTVATTLYRITCEAVVNARKHAPGATVTVELRDTVGGYTVRVSDDGPGFVPEGTGYSPTGHVGLSSMRERSEALGGWWSLESRPGEGTRVEFSVPRQPATVEGSGAPELSAAEEMATVDVADLGGAAARPAPRCTVQAPPAAGHGPEVAEQRIPALAGGSGLRPHRGRRAA